MKRLITLFALVAMVLTIFVGCKTVPEPETTPGPDDLYEEFLSEDQKAQIANKIVLKYDTVINWDYENPYFGDPYYGTINSCMIIMLSRGTIISPSGTVGIKRIADYQFLWPAPIYLYAYRDGEVLKLQEAYENGWLTQEQIGKIYEKHQGYYALWQKRYEQENAPTAPFVPDPDVLYKDPLSEKKRQEIDDVFFEQYDEKLNWNPVYSYYGNINSCDIIMDVKSAVVPCYEMIAGYKFEWGNPFKIYAYRDGEICRLQEAYEKGWLTKVHIAEIHAAHNIK